MHGFKEQQGLCKNNNLDYACPCLSFGININIPVPPLLPLEMPDGNYFLNSYEVQSYEQT